MIAGPPPGRVARLFRAWADWLFDKLAPPEPQRTVKTQPPKLVKSVQDTNVSRVTSASRR